MNNNKSKTIDLNGLKPEQIKQLQSIIENFKQQNQREATLHPSEEHKQGEIDSLNDIFFESEIIQPFNRTMLYGKRG
jgi:hypothetical protein